MNEQPVTTDLSLKLAALANLQATYTNVINQNAFNPQNGFFSPGTPLIPIEPLDEAREFEYQPGYNLYIQPRAGEKYGMLPFTVLRGLARSSKEIRLNIEHIKRQVRGLKLEFTSSGESIVVEDTEYSAAMPLVEINALFKTPDGVYDYDAWLNMLLEELLVTDAVTIYPVYSMGKICELRLIDGTTIRPFLDYNGQTPRVPAPAYGQMLHGIVKKHFRTNQLIYRPLNTKVYSPYGESPIEWILLSINTAIRHDLQRLGAFTEGNIPGAFIPVPDTWTPGQISEFNDFMDALLKGDTNRVNKFLFIPGGTGSGTIQFTQNDVDKLDVDKYQMQVACWAFGNEPSEFDLVPGDGLGGTGFAQAAVMRQHQNMTRQIVSYLENLFNDIIREWMGIQGVTAKLIGADPPQDATLLLNQDNAYLDKVYTVEYIQDRMAIPVKFRPEKNAIPPKPVVDMAAFAPFLQRAVGADLSLWKERAARALKKGWAQAAFMSDVIPLKINAQIYDRLQKAATAADIDAAFDVDNKAMLKAVSLGVDGGATFRNEWDGYG